MPQTLTIIFLLIVLMAILTWIVPSGNFERVDIDGRSVVVAGTYEKHHQIHKELLMYLQHL